MPSCVICSSSHLGGVPLVYHNSFYFLYSIVFKLSTRSCIPPFLPPLLLFFLSPSSDYFGIHLFMLLCTLEIAVVLCLYFVHYLWNSIPILRLLFGPILIYSNPCFLTDSSCVVFILSSGHAIPYTASIFYFSGLSYMLKWERTVV